MLCSSQGSQLHFHTNGTAGTHGGNIQSQFRTERRHGWWNEPWPHQNTPDTEIDRWAGELSSSMSLWFIWVMNIVTESYLFSVGGCYTARGDSSQRQWWVKRGVAVVNLVTATVNRALISFLNSTLLLLSSIFSNVSKFVPPQYVNMSISLSLSLCK